jgi:Spy/CpxP family protein refolding chaperone
MKGHILIVPAAVLATATAVAILAAEASDRSPTLDPGFVPNTGQINPGHAAEPWNDALPQAPQPRKKLARR